MAAPEPERHLGTDDGYPANATIEAATRNSGVKGQTRSNSSTAGKSRDTGRNRGDS
jgi:hypothetical protein